MVVVGGRETLWWCRGDRRTPRGGERGSRFGVERLDFCRVLFFCFFVFLHTDQRSFSIPLRSVRRFSLRSALDSSAIDKQKKQRTKTITTLLIARQQDVGRNVKPRERKKVRRDKFERSCAAPLKVTLPPLSLYRLAGAFR